MAEKLFVHNDQDQERPISRWEAAQLQMAGHLIVDAKGNHVLLNVEDLEVPAKAEASHSGEATEAAAELAEAEGVDLAEVEGSGAGGRVVKGDVEAFLEAESEEEADE